MQVTSTTTTQPRRARARVRKAGRLNTVRPARSAKRSPPLALAEIDLIRAYQAGDERAGNALLQTHATLIHETARPYFCGSHRDDVLQEARCGFLEGVMRFDEAAGVKLATYAVHWIRHSAEVYLTEHGSSIRVPDHAQRATANEHAQGLAQRARRCGRLDAPLGDEDSETRGDLLGDEDVQTLGDLLPDGRETPETVAAIASQRAHYRRMIEPLLDALSPLEREILLRCVMAEKGSEKTHAAVGAKIGVSRKRVETILYAVLEKLRRRLAMVGVMAVEDADEADRDTFARVQRLPRVLKSDER
jgi:RNA polymerase sigma-32 factor